MCLSDLWLPILVSAAAVFVASSVIWMATPLHKGDYKRLAGEAQFNALLTEQSPPVGRYMVGWCADDEAKGGAPKMHDPNGPRGVLLVARGPMSMGRLLGVWVLHLLVVSALVGYVATLAVHRGAGFLPVFRAASVPALLAYAAGAVPKAIWEALPWKLVPGMLLDGVVYAAATGAVFGALWPS